MKYSETSPESRSGLPAPPDPADFDGEEDFDEARGYWQGHVGKIIALREKAKRNAEIKAQRVVE